ncbi:MAG: hypothetical protein POELPBGB_00095 [Bacteroidia bacterium]|nr:hypothetical protein [Bacteroidia bacterium]
MLNPIRLCFDLFDNEKLSNANLRGFTDNFLIRLALNNPGGIYTGLITDTTGKYTAFYGKITNEAVKDAISQGLTIATNNAKTAVIGELSNLQNLVKYRFGETSSTYQEFYPHGMDEYHQAKIDDIATILDRFVVAATTHLTAAEAAQAVTLTGNFKTARNAQVTVFAEVDILGTGKHADRKALTMQLTVDFLTIASNNVDNPDGFDDYYDPRFLPLTDAGQSVLREGEINSGQILVIDTDGLDIGPDTDLLLENNTTTTIRYFFTNAPGNGPTGSFVDVGPNDSKAVKCSEISFTAASPVLSAQNIGPVTGKFRVRIFQ